MPNDLDMEDAAPAGLLRRAWKYGSLAAVLAISAYLLWPDASATGPGKRSAATVRQSTPPAPLRSDV